MALALGDFATDRIDCGEVSLFVRRAGRGAPLVLLHGYPQTGAAWERIAGPLSRDFDVIVPDLRGYGRSDAPPDDAGHTVYSKRRMAADIVGLLDALGIARAGVLGHDRGARVAYRMALDHPGRVSRLAVVGILPTGAYWDLWTAETALAAYHWTFLAQPAPLPERMIGADGPAYADWTLRSWSGTGDLSCFEPAALEAYRRQMADPRRVAAMCADYRAGATTDRQDDLADLSAGRRIAAPTLLVHGDRGFPARAGDPARIWSDWADRVETASCTAGHFVIEEAPDAVLAAVVPFFANDGDDMPLARGAPAARRGFTSLLRSSIRAHPA